MTKSLPGAFLVLLSSLFLAPLGLEAAPACEGEEIVKLERPYNPKDPHSKTFTYRFRIARRDQSNSLPPVIFLPGGPGNTSMNNRNSSKTFTYIFTDPRGVGCNSNIDPQFFPADFFSTENLASDVLAIIKSQNLSSYILRGQSYGTQLATVIAGRAEKGEAPRPTGVILEGILGHAFKGTSTYDGFYQQWENLKKELDPEYVEILSAKTPPLGLTSDEWGKAIATLLILGSKETSGYSFELQDLLPSLVTTSADIKNTVRDALKSFSTPVPAMEQALYKSIVCHELTKNDNMDLALIDGKLVGNRNPDFCKGTKALATPYDAKEHQTTAPIYYFQGKVDPATTVEQAIYHFNSQTKAPRYLSLFPTASHLLGGALYTCQEEILKAVANKGEGLQSAVKNCEEVPTLKTQLPN